MIKVDWEIGCEDLGELKIWVVASDSMGVRSMALMIEIGDDRIFIDPGAALGPKRYGLPPTPQEVDALQRATKGIENMASKSNILIVSHYHYDHHFPDSDMYRDKMVLLKHPETAINKSQKERARYLLERLEGMCQYRFADDTVVERPWGRIVFSPPMPHGGDRTRLGYVVMTTIETESGKIMHTSDISGAISKKPTNYIIKTRPTFIFMDGPPTIFLGWKLGTKDLEASIENLNRIIMETDAYLVLDHHLTRDLKYMERLEEVYRMGGAVGRPVKTFAEFAGMPNNFLEAWRKDIWAKEKGDKGSSGD